MEGFVLVSFLQSFLNSPTSIIALLSATVAFFAYIYQKSEKRKDKAYQIANLYAKELIPRLRFISYVLHIVGAAPYSEKFADKMIKFDNSELSALVSISEYEKTFLNINTEMLETAGIKSGFDINACPCYNLLATQPGDSRNELLAFAFQKIVISFLNELESISMLLRYNICDEKIIYQSLQQTFLGNMKFWYYHISLDNYLNEDRYYDNLIWLYTKWRNRKIRQAVKASKNSASFLGKKLF